MADNLELSSLVSLASVKGSAARDVETSRFRTTNSAGSASAVRGKGGFDGFLKTFLGEDKSAAGKSGLSRGRNASRSGDSVASHLSGENVSHEKDGARTDDVSEEESVDSTEDTQEEDAAAAAGEAARRVWEFLYGATGAGTLDGTNLSIEAGDPMGQVAGAITDQLGLDLGAASGLSTNEMNIRAMPEALETTNASAQANSDAVLAEAEAAIAEMTGGDLESLLKDAIAEQEVASEEFASVDTGLFERMAEELDVKVVSVGGGESELLASLASGAAYNGMPADAAAEKSSSVGNMPGAADISGSFEDAGTAVEEWTELFQEFIEEKRIEDPTLLSDAASPEGARKLADSFAGWLTENGKGNEAKQLTEHPNKFIQSLITGLSGVSGKESAVDGAGSAGKEIFTQIKNNLESWLHNNSSVKTNEAGALPLEEATGKLNQGIFDEVLEAGFGGAANSVQNAGGIAAAHHHGQQSIPPLARADSTNPAAMSTMMDQIENVERVAEAMKMANRNGVKNLTVQLTPEEMGKVVLRVESRDGVVNAYLRVERPEAVAQLGTNLAQLRENLKAAGVELGSVTIEQRGQNETLGDFSGQRQGGGEDGESRNRVHWRRDDAEKNAVDPAPGNKPPSGPNASGGLNLVA